MRNLIIGIIVFFLGLMAVVWIVAERADPQMIRQPPAAQSNR
jgi:hypothetical protein